MADNTIDSLQLEISADANIAEKSLNRLADSLIKLQSSVGALGNGQFQNLAAGIRQLSDSMERFSGGVKTADFTRIATGLSKLSGVNVQGVSDASRAISTLTTNLSQIGSLAFDSQGIAKIANAIAQLGRKTVTQATANIPLLSMALSGLINEMNGIGTLNFDTKGLSELVAAISKLGGKTATTAASGNIKNLAIALKKMMVTLSTAPKVSQNLIQMTQALAQLASTGGRAGTATASLTRNFNALPSSVHKARSSFNGLAGAIGKFYATYWLLIRGMGQFKKAIDISSSLTEVQNVVDVSFGDMSNKMDEFADSALRLYGMSELTAKQIGSRFQAMGVAMGFAQKDMTDMSIRLTQLAGDLASFYNISQDSAAQKLQSIFTGETEPMRQLGLDLSFATVEAWALANGLEADMQKMTQAEKTMLRYQFVLANTGAASGDFLRTVNSWHNQLVLLTGAFQQLGSIVGGVLINAFKPFIQALNSVMGAVISFAETVSNALGAIFGWEYQTGGGVAQDLELGAGAAEEIEDATGGAADNAKKLNKYIAAWHEVNNMTTNDGTSGSGGGGGGGAGGSGAAASGGEWVQAESIWEKYTSSIDTLYGLGKYISSVLTKAMNDIDWDSVYEGARNFGSGLASFLNGLINPELFGSIGTTIAGALNTALHALDSFGETFDWKNFGESIATGINNFFDTFDFGLLANTINTWLNGILDAAISFVKKTKWDEIGEEIGKFLERIDFSSVGKKVGQLLWEAINAGVKLWAKSFVTAPIETAVITAFGISKFTPVISPLIKSFNSIGDALKTLSKGGLLEGKTAFEKLLNAMALTVGGAGTFSESIALMFPSLAEFATKIKTMGTNAQVAFQLIAEGQPVIDSLALSFPKIAGILSAIASNPWAAIAVAIGGVTTAVIVLEELFGESEIDTYLEDVRDLAEEIKTSSQNRIDAAENAKEKISEAGGYEQQAVNDLMQSYIDLEKEAESVERNEKMSEYAQKIAELMPEAGKYIDETTGRFKLQGDEIQKLISKTEEYYKLQAAQEELTAAYKNLYYAERDVSKAQEEYDNITETVTELQQKHNEVIKNSAGLHSIYESDLINARNAQTEMKEALDAANESVAAQKEEIDNIKVSIDGYTEVLEAADQEAIANAKSTTEFKQSLSDLNADLSNINLNLSDAFKDSLVLEGFDSSVLKDFFDGLAEGVPASAVELTNAFSSLGMSLPNEIITAMEGMDAATQEGVSSLIMSMKSGVEVSIPEVQQLFSDFGYQIPSALISSFLEMEPSVQENTMALLLKVSDGQKLVAENILTVFSTFGIDVPNSIIESLESMEGSVQSQAIDLLLQLSEAEEEERPILIEKLNNLGIDVSKAFGESLTSDLLGIKDKGKQLPQNAYSGAEEASKDTDGSNIFKKLGKFSLEGFIEGLSDNTLLGSIAKAGAKIFNMAKEAVEDDGEIGSPSKALRRDGQYSIQGFNLGLEDEMGSTYALVDNWMNNLMSRFGGNIPTVDLSVDTSKYQFKPMSINTSPLQTEMQESLDYMISGGSFIDYNRLGNAVYQAQSQAMKENPVKIGDKDIFTAAQRQQRREYRRTFKTGWAGID